MFYEFNQNNSGGRFVVNKKLCQRVIIEADTSLDAVHIAEGLGMYWNGVEKGIDCSCCGDRWCDDMTYALKTIDDKRLQYFTNTYCHTNPGVRVFMKDGTIKEFYKQDSDVKPKIGDMLGG
jgi:hypothetical protein